MKKMNILVLFTCYNRKEFSLRAIKQINKENSKFNIDFLIVDDGSTDGTVNEINNLKLNNINVIVTPGSFYYSKSMNYGMRYTLDSNKEYDNILLINDDVDFVDNILEKLINYQIKYRNSIVVGATCDINKKLSYGGVKYKNKYTSKYNYIGPNSEEIICDTFNGNCVLIPFLAFKKAGPIDENYVHTYGDFDYGITLKKLGYKIIVLNEYAGICERNSKKNTWEDNTLSIKERLSKKKSPKGTPFKQTFYYYKKNFNIIMAIKCALSPYIKILIKK